MRKMLILWLLLCSSLLSQASSTGSFVVKGDIDKYYPVTFADGNWGNNRATKIEIGRSAVHTDDIWRGSLIASFNYHTTIYGNGTSYINAEIRSKGYGAYGPSTITTFVGGWSDASYANGSGRIIIWLRGGTTTYYYRANADANPIVYDGIQNGLPFQEENGPAHNYKTTVDSYVSNNGSTLDGDMNIAGSVNVGNASSLPIYKLSVNGAAVFDTQGAGSVVIGNANTSTEGFTSMLLSISEAKNGYSSIQSVKGSGVAWGSLILNRYGGNVGIGTINPTQKLSVDGTVLAKKVKVSQSETDWPDYVFDSSYQLPSLDSVSTFIQANKHLPDMPSAATVEKDGHDLGEVQKLLLKKMEEMTLYILQQQKKMEEIEKVNAEIKKENTALRNDLNRLSNETQ